MASSAKLKPFFQKIDAQVIYEWRETVTGNETIRERLEEALKDNALKHKKMLIEKYKKDF